MGLRFEAWTLPTTGTFTRLIADIPVVEGSGTGTVRMNVAADGSLAVPADYPRLSTIISDTAGSLIRVYDGSTLVHEWMAEKVDYGYAADTVRVSGPDLSTVFDRTIVYPYDYPTTPSTVGDWIWGGRNILSNEGFEDSPVTPTTVELRITASGGSYTLTDGTDTTSSIAWNADAATITTRIETDLGLLPNVTVALAGSGVWLITFVEPQFGVTLTINTGSLTGGTGTVTTTVEGGYGLGAWTTARALVSGLGQLGAYDFFGVTDNTPDTGDLALDINPGPVGATSNRLGGAQQVVSATPGGTYQASVRVRPTSGSDEIRFAIFSDTEQLLATNAVGGAAFTPNVYSTISLPDVAIPDNVDRVIFRVQNANSFPHNPSLFSVDNAAFNEGLQPATVGEIVGMLMDDATTDHAADTRGTLLEWVDYSGFSTTVDSSSDTWDDELEFTAHRGMTYGQVFDDLVALGYEWRLVAKATPVGGKTHDLEWFNTGNMDAGPAVGVTVGQNTPDTSVVKRIPKYTAVLVEGDDGLYAEDSDTTAESNFGRFETYSSSNQWTGTTTLGAAGDHVLDEESSNRVALQVEIMEGAHSRPLVDYTAGDTISVQFPPNLAKTERRVHQISYRNTNPTTYNLTGSRLFPAETGAWEALRILIRRFRRLEEPPPSAAFVPGGGGAPTVVVAAANASEFSKGKADPGFVCSGVNDHAVIQAALDSIAGARVLLTEGIYSVDTDQIVLSADSHLMGMGAWGTVLQTTDTSGTFIECSGSNIISDLSMVRISTANTLVGIELAQQCQVHRCVGEQLDTFIVQPGGDDCIVTDSFADTCEKFLVGSGTYERLLIQGNTQVGVVDLGGSAFYVSIVGNIFTARSGLANIVATGATGVVVADNIFVATTQDIGVSNSTDWAVTGNISSAGDTGYVFDTCQRVTIVGNVIGAEGFHAGDGIVLTDCSDCVLEANHVIQPGQNDDNTFDGIRLEGDSNDNLVTANRTLPADSGGDQTRYGINIADATCDNNAVYANYLGDSSEYGTADSVDNGTGTQTSPAAGAIGGQFAF